MPGTQNAPCYFTDCEYYDFGWHSVNFYSAMAAKKSDDWDEWEVIRGTSDSNKFYIYDKKPLPYKK